jgi:hypothetical protein
MSDTAHNTIRTHLQAALAAIPAPTNIDPIDTAFLCIGAAEALSKLEEAEHETVSDGLGMTGVIDNVLDHAPTLGKLWAELTQDTPGEWGGGVYAYDVAEPLGAELIRQWAATGSCPTVAEGLTIARNIARDALGSWAKAGKEVQA